MSVLEIVQPAPIPCKLRKPTKPAYLRKVNELEHLTREIMKVEKLSRFHAERKAIELMLPLREFMFDWDYDAGRAGNPEGLPF